VQALLHDVFVVVMCNFSGKIINQMVLTVYVSCTVYQGDLNEAIYTWLLLLLTAAEWDEYGDDVGRCVPAYLSWYSTTLGHHDWGFS